MEKFEAIERLFYMGLITLFAWGVFSLLSGVVG